MTVYRKYIFYYRQSEAKDVKNLFNERDISSKGRVGKLQLLKSQGRMNI